MKLQSNGQVTVESQQDFALPFFRLAFRPFFWLGSLFGAVSIAVWTLLFTGLIEFQPYGGSYFWHVHEMLFGFTTAIIVGFLLTAVQTWTGVPSIKGVPLIFLVLTWLFARVSIAFHHVGFELYTAVIDVLFLPLAAFALAIPIIKAKLWRNLFFVPILLAMAAVNTFSHLAVMGKIAISFITISHVMVLLVTLVMCIMGGRVFPMFTANGTGTPRVPPIHWIEKLAIASVLLSVLISSDITSTPKWLDAFIYGFAGLVNLTRAIRWRVWVTLNTPLVWSLHLSYWSICIGLIMLSLAELSVLSNPSLAFHAITVGGIGFMVLSMISRVSLGHTGRSIKVGKVMTMAFLLIGFSFVIRVFFPLLFNSYELLIWLSGALWVSAYGLFIICYAPILFSSRIDGANG